MTAKAQFRPKTASSNRRPRPGIDDTTGVMSMGFIGNDVLVSNAHKAQFRPESGPATCRLGRVTARLDSSVYCQKTGITAGIPSP
jgi:hypothetical protein